MRIVRHLPRFWRRAFLSMAATTTIAVPLIWLISGTIEGALVGIPLGLIGGLLGYFHEWQTYDKHE